MSKTKLERVMELVINNKADAAAALLHEVFIEKARSFHETLMHDDDDAFDRMNTLGGDKGDKFRKKISRHSTDMDDLGNEIEAEETYGSHMESLDFDDDDVVVVDGDDDENFDDDLGDDDDENFDDDDDLGDDMSMDDDDGEPKDEEFDDRISDLEDALAELKAEFDRLENDGDDEDMDDTPSSKDFDDEPEREEDEMDEDWLEEQFADLEESLKLEVIKNDMYAGGSSDSEIGNGPKFATPTGKAKSAVPPSQTSRMGAKPVRTGKGGHTGYSLETAPTSVYGTGGEKDGMPSEAKKDNRRGSAKTGMTDISSGNYGVKRKAGSKLETTADEFKVGRTKSPLQNMNRKD